MTQQVYAARTTTPSTTPTERDDLEMAAVRVRLDDQRRFRTEQLVELAVAGAVATADDARGQVRSVLKKGAESALAEIDAALDRLAAGAYGSCDRCAELIPQDRLEVLPAARLCTRCQFRIASGYRRASRPGRVGR